MELYLHLVQTRIVLLKQTSWQPSPITLCSTPVLRLSVQIGFLGTKLKWKRHSRHAQSREHKLGSKVVWNTTSTHKYNRPTLARFSPETASFSRGCQKVRTSAQGTWPLCGKKLNLMNARKIRLVSEFWSIFHFFLVKQKETLRWELLICSNNNAQKGQE